MVQGVGLESIREAFVATDGKSAKLEIYLGVWLGDARRDACFYALLMGQDVSWEFNEVSHRVSVGEARLECTPDEVRKLIRHTRREQDSLRSRAEKLNNTLSDYSRILARLEAP